MSQSLGTLWFGADIDLTALKQKIQSGNQSILDALKMNYDPASYTQMVSKLKSELAKETFEIKIDTNAQQIRQQLNQTVSSISNSANAPILNMSGLSGIQKMKGSMADLTETIVLQREKVKNLWEEYKRVQQTFGKGTVQAQAAKASWKSAADSLFMMRTNAGLLGVDIKRATLSSAALKEQMKQNAEAAKQWNSDHMRLNATLAGGIHVSTQLGSALSSLFAIDAARQFLGYVIEIGGQLEKQRISIGAILGDTVKANHLFEQIKGLALKSPFGVVELDQYTKQLSAYGFKYNELYDMTRRLADISAGAGQDIGRLTLALGHVRSATYLTGITLRQFSMNNIPMLKMLADYYSEVEKRAVSTAEVQQRISKRQVSYEDVIEQIRRLTDEGGMFYNMQEKISESLAARYKNLKDAMDIMYGEMAEGSVGDALKELANILLKTTRHWKEIINVMGVAAAGFMIGKIRIGLATATLQGNTAATLKQIMATKQLEANNLRAASSYRKLTIEELRKVATAKTLTAQDITLAVATKQLTTDEVLNAIALKKVSAAEAQALVTTGMLTQAELDAALATNAWSARLSVLGGKLRNAFAGIGWGTWLTFGAMAGMELYMAVDQWNQKIDDKAKDIKDLIKSRINDLKKMKDSLDEEGMPKDSTALKGRIDEMKQVLANSEAYTVSIDDQVTKAGSLNEQYNILSGAIEKATEKNRNMLDVQDDIAKMIKASSIGNADGVFNHGFWEFPLVDFFFNDDITKNMEQTLNSYTELRKVIEGAWEYKDAIKGVIDEMKKSGEITDEFAVQLKNAPFEEQIRLLAESGYWQKIKDEVTSQYPYFLNFSDNIIKASNDVTKRWQEIANDDIPKMLKKEAERRGISERELHKWCLDNIDDFKIMLDGIADQLDIKEPAIRERLKRLFYSYVKFSKLAEGNVSQENIENTERDLMNYLGVEDENLRKLLGLDPLATIKDSNTETPTGGDKKDMQLEAAKTRLQQYKTFLSEYKKYYDQYGREKALNILETLFPDLKDKEGNFLGSKLVDDFVGMLDKLRNSLKLTTEARKKWANDLDKTKAENVLAFDTERAKKEISEMQEYINKQTSKWDLFKKLFEKTGNRTFAGLAFDDGMIFDGLSEELADELKLSIENAGKDIDISSLWSKTDAQAQEMLKGINGAYDLWKKIVDIIRNNYIDSLNKGADAIAHTLDAEQKLAKIEQELLDLQEKRNKTGISEAEKNSLDYQIAAKNQEKKDAERDVFKQSKDYLNFYNAILSLTIPQAEEIGRKIKKNLNDELRDGKLSARQYLNEIKKINEQLEKLQKSQSNLSAFVNGGLSGLFQNMKDIGDNKWERGLNDLRQAEKDYTNAVTKYNIAQSNGNKAAMEQADAQMQGAESAMQGAKAMIQGGEAMSAGASSAMSTVAIIDMIVHGINDAVQGVKSAFDDIRETMKAAGKNTDTESWNEWGAFFDSFSSASNSATSAWDSLKNGNIGGVISGVVGSFTGWYKGIAKAWDKKMDRQIEYASRQLAATERLRNAMERQLNRTLSGVYGYKTSQENLDKLKEARNKTEEVDEKTYSERWRDSATGALKGALYGFTAAIYKNNIVRLFAEGLKSRTYTVNYYQEDTIKKMDEAIKSQSYYDEQLALLYKQRDEIQHQLASEEDKKDSDNEKIEGYKEQLAELKDQIEYFADDMAKTLYDIDFKSWASELADALVSAWAAGESGAEAYKKKVSEILRDLGVKMITERIVAQKLEPIMNEFLDQYEKDDGILTQQGMNILAKMYDVGEELEEKTNAFMDGINEIARERGADLKDSTSSSTSSSIQGVTEQTADLLASYMNAIRADVSANRATIALYYPQFLSAISQVSVLSQTQVTLQTQIAANTLRNAEAADKIYNILHESQTGAIRLKVS